MKEDLIKALSEAAAKAGVKDQNAAVLGYPENPEHGDFSSNIAMVHAKALKMNPKALAEKIVGEFSKDMPAIVSKVEIAGPGFINLKLKDEAFVRAVLDNAPKRSSRSKKEKVMVEYTDPNPFKIFHIGHLMSNAIGESVSRLIEHSGVEVIRVCYQGDVGLHVAKTVWAVMHEDGAWEKLQKLKTVTEKVKFLGEMYVLGSSHDEEPSIQKEIVDINKKIFEKSDKDISEIYDYGRKVSLEYFDTVYARLGTKFDRFFFESDMATHGLKIVEEFLKKGTFEKSEGAVVFKGEEHGLHTRVFINSHGLPTYEAKELGLNVEKFKLYPGLLRSVIVTGNEINEYFKVLKKVLSIVAPAVAEKTDHIGHGMLRFSSGKMSSRKGNIISAESLIEDVRAMVIEKMTDRKLPAAEENEIADAVAVAAIKYSVLRQAPGGDVIFDSSKSVSFEGDSGPYLQYAAVRANSVLEKARAEGMNVDAKPSKVPDAVGALERLLARFADIADRAAREYAPQHIAGYLIDLAGAFNNFYANNQIVDSKEPLSQYRIALTKSFLATMTEGLHLLGIKVPKKM